MPQPPPGSESGRPSGDHDHDAGTDAWERHASSDADPPPTDGEPSSELTDEEVASVQDDPSDSG